MSHVTGNATPVKWLGFYMSDPKGNNINNFRMHAFLLASGVLNSLNTLLFPTDKI